MRNCDGECGLEREGVCGLRGCEMGSKAKASGPLGKEAVKTVLVRMLR
jgi:hypothetical protein